MTSKVEVDAHAGWPIKVVALDQTRRNGSGVEETVLGIVDPGKKQVFYIHSSRKLLIEEMPYPQDT